MAESEIMEAPKKGQKPRRIGYLKMKVIDDLKKEAVPKEKIGEKLPWVHIAFSNAKRQLLNSYHNVKPEFLQAYLNEFCYKFNRRYFGEALFGRLLVAAVSSKNEFRYNTGNHTKLLYEALLLGLTLRL